MTLVKPGFIGTTPEGTMSAHIKKMRYSIHAEGPYPHVINFNMGEMLFYGRMNEFDIPISLARVGTPYLKGTTRTEGSTPMRALGFVMEVFEEMALQFDKAAATALIPPNDKFLSSLKIYRAFEDPLKSYDNYKRAYIDSLRAQISKLPASETFTNIDEFFIFFLNYVKGAVRDAPFTYPSYIKSRLCDIMCSGLAIEIADLTYSNDEEKVKQFYDNRCWDYYVNACNQYGFRIDKNYPWRIVADLESDIMTFAARKHHITEGRLIFDSIYEIGAKTYLRNILQDILQIYNALRQETYTEEIPCREGGMIRRAQPVKKYRSPGSLLSSLTIFDILNFYMTLRIYEQKPDMDDFKKQTLISDCFKLYRSSGDLTLPIAIFESIVSSTVDKEGSFSYYKKHFEAFYKDMYERGLVDSIQISSIGEEASTGGGY